VRILSSLLTVVVAALPVSLACSDTSANDPVAGAGTTSAGGSAAGAASGGASSAGTSGASADGSISAGKGGAPATGGVVGAGGSGGAAGGQSAGAGGGGNGGSGGGSGAAGNGGAGGASAACANAKTLKDAGSCSNRLIGVALSKAHLADPQYAAAALEFNYVTPENEMKWDVTEPQQGNFTFQDGDAIVDFAAARGMKVKGHTLVWHNQLPDWLTSLSASALRTAMTDHIAGVMEHYKGKVIAWDVVNEAFEEDGQLRSSIWSQKLGATFIDDAFKAARAADPTVKLYYNDYDIESDYPKADSVYEMVKSMKERGIPIDGVGMQMHTRTTDEDPPVPEFIANLERLLALGVEVVLSEMDVRYCDNGTDEQQKKRFHDIVAACVARPGCGAITIWGITDQHSFLNDRTDLQCAGPLPPRPLLWNDEYQKKPSFDGVMDALLGK
jgi:endo-1,4-beta-xylanase